MLSRHPGFSRPLHSFFLVQENIPCLGILIYASYSGRRVTQIPCEITIISLYQHCDLHYQTSVCLVSLLLIMHNLVHGCQNVYANIQMYI